MEQGRYVLEAFGFFAGNMLIYSIKSLTCFEESLFTPQNDEVKRVYSCSIMSVLEAKAYEYLFFIF